MQQFRAVIFKAGINPYVDVPSRVSKAFAVRGYVHVTVHIGTGEVRSTLVPMGEGKHRLYINRIMLRLASAKVGDRVSIGLILDPVSRMPEMPEQFASKLATLPRARKAWSSLATSKRKEILTYLNHAKSNETFARNIAKTVAILDSDEVTGVLSGIKIQVKISEKKGVTGGKFRRPQV